MMCVEYGIRSSMVNSALFCSMLMIAIFLMLNPKYLGMTLDFSTKCQVKMTMTDYVSEIIQAWDEAELKA